METDYAVTVDGRPVAVHPARVSAHPLNQVWPGYQRPLDQTELAAFASWDLAAPVDVAVTCGRPIGTVRIRPAVAGIAPEIDGAAIRFRLDRPGAFTVEVNGSHHALHLFADPPETDAPDPSTPGIRFFGPGVHHPGLIRLASGESVYLARGAVVYGAILAEGAEGIAIRGRGILDGSGFDRLDLTALIGLYDCRGVTIDGPILRDSGVFTIAPVACRDVVIRHVKIIGNWRYNSDGIDFMNGRSLRVEDCFIRTFDDCLCLKGYESFGPFLYQLQLAGGQWDGTFVMPGQGRFPFADLQRRFGIYPTRGAPVRDVRVRGCVFWCDWGRALEIGAETAADDISDVRFEDCDIIHASDVALDVQNGDRARCRDIVFRDIRVEMDDTPRTPVLQRCPGERYTAPSNGYLPHLIVLENKITYVTIDAERGLIEDIRFEDISVTAPRMPPSRLIGFDPAHPVRRVTIHSLTLNGKPVMSLPEGGFACNDHVTEITLR